MAEAAGSRPALRNPVWIELGTGLAVGLYLARVASEVLPGTRTAPQVVFLIILGLVVAWYANRGLDALRLPRGELLLLTIYVLWPVASLWAAGAVGMLGIGLWLWRLPTDRTPQVSWVVRRAPELIVGLGGLYAYWRTVAPTLLPSDAGEFQLVATTLGIAHPPGYPLYTVLGKLATLVPVGDQAYRVNLMSVVFASATLALLAYLVRLVAITQGGARGAAWSAVIAAFSLAVAPTFWVQATTANIRSLTALFTALLLVLAVRWTHARTPRRLVLLAFAFGLAAGHHGSLMLLGLPLAAYLLTVEPRLWREPRRWLPAAGAFAFSLVVLLYLPLRSATDPAFDPAPINTVQDFVSHVLALGFSGDMLYLGSGSELLERVGTYLQIVRLQFGLWIALATVGALIGVFWRNWRLGLLLGGFWLVNAASAITYRAPQTVEYLLPSYVAMAATLGCGLRLIAEWLPQRRRTGLVLSLVTLLLAAQGAALWPDMRVLHNDTSARFTARRLLEAAPENTLLLTNWHESAPLLYLQMIEGYRLDVDVMYVYPEGATPNEDVWIRRINEAIDERPVVVTNRFHSFSQTGLRFEPLASAWLVRREPSETPPDSAARVSGLLGERISIEAVSTPRAGRPGDTLHVTLYWRPVVQLERDYSVFVQLVGPDGAVGQADRAQLTSQYPAGQLQVDAYDLPLLLETPPGTYQLIAGFYTAAAGGWERLETGTGDDHVVLGTLQVTAGTLRAATLNPQATPFEGGYVLRGMDVDRSVDGWTRLYLHWERSGRTPGDPLLVLALDGAGAAIDTATLPGLSRGQTATVVLDLEGAPERLRLALRAGGDTTLRPLTVWRLPGREHRVLTLPRGDRRYVPLGGAMVYVDLIDAPLGLLPGQVAALRPQLLSLRPLQRDYSLSLALTGAGWSWESKADGTPALGTIPTLKWMTGWLVTSLYMPAVPDDAPAGPVSYHLEAYDAFTLTSLAVLDERLAREGQGTYVVIGEGEVLAP